MKMKQEKDIIVGGWVPANETIEETMLYQDIDLESLDRGITQKIKDCIFETKKELLEECSVMEIPKRGVYRRFTVKIVMEVEDFETKPAQTPQG